MDGLRTVAGQGRWREREAREALAELSRSGKSIAEFARRRGISAQRIYYWKKRIAEAVAPAFVAVPVTSGGLEQVEITAGGVTIRVREDLAPERLTAIVEIMARHGHGC
jgi:transposase-like protein